MSRFANVRRGVAPDLGFKTDSLLEANGARVLMFLCAQKYPQSIQYVGNALKYQHHALIGRVYFPPNNVKKYAKAYDYKPDGLLFGTAGWRDVEYKGQLVGTWKHKLQAFQKFYPERFRRTLWIVEGKQNIADLRKLAKTEIEIWSAAELKLDYAGLVNWQAGKDWDLEQMAIKAEQIPNPF